MAIDADLEKLEKQLETRLQKEFREEHEKLARDMQKSYDNSMAAIDRLDKKGGVYTEGMGKRADAEWREFKEHRERSAKAVEELSRDQNKRVEAMEKALDDSRSDTIKSIGSTEQTLKRLEREIDILTKDLAALKKEALSGADLKPLADRIKKLEK